LETDFSGSWVRDNAASQGMVEFLLAHGQSQESAERKAATTYAQVRH